MLKKKYLKTKAICQVTFCLSANEVPQEGEIRVLGDFNNWQWAEAPVMELKSGTYSTKVDLPTGKTYEYRYCIDGHFWFNDPAADTYVPAPFYGVSNCLVALETVVIDTPKTSTAKTKAAAKPKKTVKKAKTDNLKKIEGIGPKIEKLLKERGITTFNDLAKAEIKILQDTLDEAGKRFRMHDPTTWPEQAALAAAGEWEKLDDLQDVLKGGKKK